MKLLLTLTGLLLFIGTLKPDDFLKPKTAEDRWGLDFPAHKAKYPFRLVDGTYQNLTPIFDWFKQRDNARTAQRKLKVDRPMREWRPFLGYRVAQVRAEGILVRPSLNSTQLFYVRNFPTKGLVDGDSVTFLAKTSKKHTYIDSRQILRTVEGFDYGKPYNPRRRGPNGKALLIKEPSKK